MPFTNRYKTRAEWADCDPLGQMFYPNYFRWFDIGTHKLLDAGGEPYDKGGGAPHHRRPAAGQCTGIFPGPLPLD